MTDSLSVSFKYTKEDILGVVIESLGFDVKKCWLMLFCVILLVAVSVYCFFIKFVTFALITLLAAIFFVPVYIFAAFVNLYSVLKVLTDCVYTLEKNQLIAGSNLGFQYFNLKDIDRVILTKPLIFIFVSNKNAYFIPVRAFNSEEKANRFITELKYGIELAKREDEEVQNL